jgi:hypothetical protein
MNERVISEPYKTENKSDIVSIFNPIMFKKLRVNTGAGNNILKKRLK